MRFSRFFKPAKVPLHSNLHPHRRAFSSIPEHLAFSELYRISFAEGIYRVWGFSSKQYVAEEVVPIHADRQELLERHLDIFLSLAQCTREDLQEGATSSFRSLVQLFNSSCSNPDFSWTDSQYKSLLHPDLAARFQAQLDYYRSKGLTASVEVESVNTELMYCLLVAQFNPARAFDRFCLKYPVLGRFLLFAKSAFLSTTQLAFTVKLSVRETFSLKNQEGQFFDAEVAPNRLGEIPTISKPAPSYRSHVWIFTCKTNDLKKSTPRWTVFNINEIMGASERHHIAAFM